MASHKYKLIGRRLLRKYTAPAASPVYAASADAKLIADKFCDVPWEEVAEKKAQMTYHTDQIVVMDGEMGVSGLELNVRIRDRFDAALFCAGHVGGQHVAYANAACYRFTLPDMTSYPNLLSARVKITSDPYNSAGARVHLVCRQSASPATSCNDVRGCDDAGNLLDDGLTAAGVAPREVRTVDGKDFWYPSSETVTLAKGSGSLPLQRYLLVYVVLESYSTVRGNWLEGCSYADNLIEIETDGPIQGWEDGATIDLSNDAPETSSRLVIAGYPDDAITIKYGLSSTSSLSARDLRSQAVYCCDNGVIATYGDGPILDTLSTDSLGRLGIFIPMTIGGTKTFCSLLRAEFVGTTQEDMDLYNSWMETPERRKLSVGPVTGVSVIRCSKSPDMFYLHVLTDDSLFFVGRIKTAVSGSSTSYRFTPYNMVSGVEGTAYATYVADAGGGDLLVAACTESSHINAVLYPVRVETGSISVGGFGKLAVDGEISSVHNYGPTESGRFTVAGDLRSVGGVPVRHACVVDIRNNRFCVSPIAVDGKIDPNTFERFTVMPYTGDGHAFLVLGAFSRLGGVACPKGGAYVNANGLVLPTKEPYVAGATTTETLYGIKANLLTVPLT